jgi:hypothetical protein
MPLARRRRRISSSLIEIGSRARMSATVSNSFFGFFRRMGGAR